MDQANDNRPRRRCPICRRPAERADAPFCSPRCRQVDLARWFTGSYVVETEGAPGSEAEQVRDGRAEDG